MIKKTQLDNQAIGLIRKEKTQWESATAYVTDKVAFQMRNLIRQLRKNYWGIFDNPIDPQSGREKIWMPLTESIVESVVKNIDLDTKDITFRAKRPEAIGLTSLVRSVMKAELDYVGFGESLDELIRTIAIDGTAIWKTIEYYDDDRKKKCFKIVPVDLLNFYIDPTVHSIQEAESVIERALMTEGEIKSMKGWRNTSNLHGSTQVDRHDGDQQGTNDTGTTELIEVYERWGLMPLSFITGKEKDAGTQVHGHIVASGTGGSWKCHLIEEADKLKPYEEAWYTRVPGRWYGRGVAEKVMMLQLWMNIIVNIRITRSYVSQLGIFKIRQGAGITPQSLSRLSTNGAIVVQSMNDIEQMAMQEASQSSYSDENSSMSWARQVTGAFEAVTGETLPSSTTATIGAIQNRNATSQFTLVKEGVGMFLERWLGRHSMPITLGNIKRGTILQYYPDRLEDYDKQIVAQQVYEQIDAIDRAGGWVDPQQVMMEMDRAYASLQANGEQRFVKVLNVPDILDYDTDVQITNEDYDSGVAIQNLVQMLPAAPEYRAAIISEIFDKMGIGPFKAPTPTQVPGMTPPVAGGEQDPNQLLTQANTGEAYGKAQANISA
jgi:hypothetical protein